LSLYPNPVKDKMNIRVGKDIAQMSLQIISAIGSVVLEEEYQNVSPFENASADLSELVPGTYTAVVVMDGEEHKHTIVKL